MAYRSKSKPTFTMVSPDGDVVIADKDCEKSLLDMGYERCRKGEKPAPNPKDDEVPETNVDKAALGKFTKDQLLDLCHDNGLDQEGTKPVLVERLAAAGIGPVKE